jgi:hypothetical protein
MATPRRWMELNGEKLAMKGNSQRRQAGLLIHKGKHLL